MEKLKKMTDEFKLKLSSCKAILDHYIDHPDQDILDMYPTLKLYNGINIKKYIINIYNLNIPEWLIYIISICCGKHEYFSAQMFIELMNSIKARKFNDADIPHDYIILPEDWIECYEDGYPICTNDFGGCYDIYNDSYLSFIRQMTEYYRDRLTRFRTNQ